MFFLSVSPFEKDANVYFCRLANTIVLVFVSDYLCRMWKYFSILCVGSTHFVAIQKIESECDAKLDIRPTAILPISIKIKDDLTWSSFFWGNFLAFSIKHKHYGIRDIDSIIKWKKMAEKYVSLKFDTSFAWIHNRFVATSNLPSIFISKFQCKTQFIYKTEKFEVKKNSTSNSVEMKKKCVWFKVWSERKFLEILTVLHRRHYEQDWTEISGDRLDFGRELWCVRENRNGLIINMSEHVLWNMLWYAKGASRRERERREKNGKANANATKTHESI